MCINSGHVCGPRLPSDEEHLLEQLLDGPGYAVEDGAGRAFGDALVEPLEDEGRHLVLEEEVGVAHQRVVADRGRPSFVTRRSWRRSSVARRHGREERDERWGAFWCKIVCKHVERVRSGLFAGTAKL